VGIDGQIWLIGLVVIKLSVTAWFFVFLTTFTWKKVFPIEAKFRDCWYCPLSRKERAIKEREGIE